MLILFNLPDYFEIKMKKNLRIIYFFHVHYLSLAFLHIVYKCMFNVDYAVNVSIHLHYVLEEDRLETKT